MPGHAARARVELSRAELAALLLAVLDAQRRRSLHPDTRAELEHARARIDRALLKACAGRLKHVGKTGVGRGEAAARSARAVGRVADGEAAAPPGPCAAEAR